MFFNNKETCDDIMLAVFPHYRWLHTVVRITFQI